MHSEPRRRGSRLAAACVLLAVSSAARAERQASAPVITGEPRVWHRVTLTFDGPHTSEDATPNPFRDYRLDVTFQHGDTRVVVPGFFDGDGRAADTGAREGDAWRVHFMPSSAGRWTWRASMRYGTDVALVDHAGGGRPEPPDGLTGSIDVLPSDKHAPDFRARGLLQHGSARYLRFAGDGTWFLKGGADSPENLLAFADIDDTTTSDRPVRPGEAQRALHTFAPHVRDWRPGDPTWRGGRGKGLIGALNYLADQGMNAVYFLTMNVDGDGDDVFPWVSRSVRDRFDVSKLAQWEQVFSHMTARGLLLHVVTQETENQTLLDRPPAGSAGSAAAPSHGRARAEDNALAPLRRLYYRELIARFSHHPALVWNLGEENGPGHEGAPYNTDADRRAFIAFFKRTDPYGHPVVVHTYPGRQPQIYEPLLGNRDFDGASLQVASPAGVYDEVRRWIDRSRDTGWPWVVSLDEIGPAETGAKPDADDPAHDDLRRHVLWGTLMAGGAGVEWYFGYRYAHNDLNAEDWRSRQALWAQTRHALAFFREHAAFDRARAIDGMGSTAGVRVFGVPGERYVVYLSNGWATTLRFGSDEGAFDVRWFDPRGGGTLQRGPVARIRGRGTVELGPAPHDPAQDWAVLLTRVR